MPISFSEFKRPGALIKQIKKLETKANRSEEEDELIAQLLNDLNYFLSEGLITKTAPETRRQSLEDYLIQCPDYFHRIIEIINELGNAIEYKDAILLILTREPDSHTIQKAADTTKALFEQSYLLHPDSFSKLFAAIDPQGKNSHIQEAIQKCAAQTPLDNLKKDIKDIILKDNPKPSSLSLFKSENTIKTEKLGHIQKIDQCKNCEELQAALRQMPFQSTISLMEVKQKLRAFLDLEHEGCDIELNVLIDQLATQDGKYAAMNASVVRDTWTPDGIQLTAQPPMTTDPDLLAWEQEVRGQQTLKMGR